MTKKLFLKLKNIVWQEGKFYVAQCLNVGVSSFGKTKSEAIKNLNEALELYFEDEKKPNQLINQVDHPELVDLTI